MPDDGAWLTGIGHPLGGDMRTARARFEGVLAEFTQRLAAPEPLRRDTAVALVQQMQRLAGRMATDSEALQGRAADLSTALAILNTRLDTELAAAAAREARLTARLDQTLVELAEAQVAKRPLVGPGAVRLVLSAAALCAALCASVGGVAALSRPQLAEPPAAMGVAVETPIAEGPVAAIAAAQSPAHAELPAPPPAVPTAQRTPDTFMAVSAALARGDLTAPRRLNALAQAGDARAQLQLANLYEAGESGLARDLGAARRWTLRAARGGDRAAMYNAAIFLMEGEGGPQDMQEAGVWFRQAADRGVTDAQYNLGLMYETGRGVDPNPAEARRWFALAAKAGDAAAAAKLSDREAPGVPATGAAGGPSVADTQRYLAQQGYYLGPTDGVVSPALAAAAKAYVRDHPGRTPAL